jgi:aspartate racemase
MSASTAPEATGQSRPGVALRRLGLIGGMSWESTAEYYRLINRGIGVRLGGVASAPLLLHSVEFSAIARLMEWGNWDAIGDLLARAAEGLEREGAEAIVITSNTVHTVAPVIEASIRIPLLHIVDPVGHAMQTAGVTRGGLLGTRYTMELPFWRERMAERFGIALSVPDAAERAVIHRIIFDELCRGIIRPESRDEYVRIIDRLAADGAQAVVLGCTEITLLVQPDQVRVPLFDTTALHCQQAIRFALGENLSR